MPATAEVDETLASVMSGLTSQDRPVPFNAALDHLSPAVKATPVQTGDWST